MWARESADRKMKSYIETLFYKDKCLPLWRVLLWGFVCTLFLGCIAFYLYAGPGIHRLNDIHCIHGATGPHWETASCPNAVITLRLFTSLWTTHLSTVYIENSLEPGCKQLFITLKLSIEFQAGFWPCDKIIIRELVQRSLGMNRWMIASVFFITRRVLWPKR